MCGHRCHDKQHCGHPCCNREYYLWVSNGSVDVDESVDVKSPSPPVAPSSTPVHGAGSEPDSGEESGEDLMDSETAVADASDAAADALADAADQPTEEDKAFVASSPVDEPKPVYCEVCGTTHPLPSCRPECDCIKCDTCKGTPWPCVIWRRLSTHPLLLLDVAGTLSMLQCSMPLGTAS